MADVNPIFEDLGSISEQCGGILSEQRAVRCSDIATGSRSVSDLSRMKILLGN
jgi:hypothetical protein